MNTENYLKDNRELIIKKLQREITRKTITCGRVAVGLKGAMIIYKEVLENTEHVWEAEEAAEKAINGNIKVSKYAFLSEDSLNQLPSSMR